jgi:starch synthase
LRYGTIPVVRAVGGLEETIVEFDPASGQGTGFKFSRFDSEEFLAAIQRALSLFGNPASWEQVRQQAMMQEFSWSQAAAHYVEIYEKAQQKRLALDKKAS